MFRLAILAVLVLVAFAGGWALGRRRVTPPAPAPAPTAAALPAKPDTIVRFVDRIVSAPAPSKVRAIAPGAARRGVGGLCQRWEVHALAQDSAPSIAQDSAPSAPLAVPFAGRIHPGGLFRKGELELWYGRSDGAEAYSSHPIALPASFVSRADSVDVRYSRFWWLRDLVTVGGILGLGFTAGWLAH